MQNRLKAVGVEHPVLSGGRLMAPSGLETTSARLRQVTTTTGRFLRMISGDRLKGAIEKMAGFPGPGARFLMSIRRNHHEIRSRRDSALRPLLPCLLQGVAWAAAEEEESHCWTNMVEQVTATWKCVLATWAVGRGSAVDGTTAGRLPHHVDQQRDRQCERPSSGWRAKHVSPHHQCIRRDSSDIDHDHPLTGGAAGGCPRTHGAPKVTKRCLLPRSCL